MSPDKLYTWGEPFRALQPQADIALPPLLVDPIRWSIPDPGAAMRRRDFVKGVAGSAVAWPLLAGAQQIDAMLSVGIEGDE